jgi:hypothetical protein
MGIRTFSLNSREFYESVCPPADPWVWAGGLPKEPQPRGPDVLVEVRGRKR